IIILSLIGDINIVMTVIISPSLGSPMYFFLASLSVMDTVYSTAISPKLIVDLLRDKKTISFTACIHQIFIEDLFGGVDIVILVAMAYDHYVAICKLLHYIIIMNRRVCILFLVMAWVGGFVHALIQVLPVYKLPFCGDNITDHFGCDIYPLLLLARTDTYFIGLSAIVNNGAMCLVIFILLLLSYGIILKSLKIHSQEGRHKALFTCSSHVTVVFLFFVPCIFMYARPIYNFSIDKFIAVFYTIFTPMLNPLIYTLRNSEMKNYMEKFRCKKLATDRIGMSCH
ncbi:olfactory receptor 4A8-like, partial [Microtus oregoni]|uniref:olfactory receptor 4A8-like n=1 Tax=Microtus oregoni TaxID=111838 RepID=UPI001BB2010E